MEPTSSKMASHMKVASKMESKVGEGTDTRMEMCMRENGKMISSKAKELCGILILISMKDNG